MVTIAWCPSRRHGRDRGPMKATGGREVLGRLCGVLFHQWTGSLFHDEFAVAMHGADALVFCLLTGRLLAPRS